MWQLITVIKGLICKLQDDVECLFFAYAQEGIPVLVKITYDLIEDNNLESEDFILLTRLDTDYSSVKTIKRNIIHKEDLVNEFNYLRFNLENAYETTEEMINNIGSESSIKLDNGECGLKLSQPANGY